ncbi:MAG: ABC transporter permease subunit [Myxococcota bacterium]
MKAAWTVMKREVRSFFISPIAYVVLTAWVGVNGLVFYQLATYFSRNVSQSPTDTPLSLFFGSSIFIHMAMLVFVPVMTMRLVAEERSSGTIEPLLTAPIGERAVVFGKYAAALVFWMALWAPTLLYVWITSNYGGVDLGVVGSSYLGVMGVGVYYTAIGLLMSVLSRNQIIAAVLTFMVLGLLFAIGVFEFVVPEHRDVFAYLSVWTQMDTFAKGIVDSRYLVFDLSLAAVSLFIAVRVLEARRFD